MEQFKRSTYLQMWLKIHKTKFSCILDMFSYVFSQQKLEEALLFSGMFQDALQSLFDWLETVEPSLSSETAIMGDTQTVHILMDNHKVQLFFTSSSVTWILQRVMGRTRSPLTTPLVVRGTNGNIYSTKRKSVQI